MECPKCQSFLRRTDTRCAVCEYKRRRWYINLLWLIALVAIAVLFIVSEGKISR